MGAESTPVPRGGWTIERAEELLGSLTGVVSVRIVAQPGGDIQEIHLLTTEEVSPKQTVRNVESALLAQLDLAVDHRKISVARTSGGEGGDEPSRFLQAVPSRTEERLLFVGHQTESQRSHSVRMSVAVEWKGERYEGHAEGTDLPRSRLETVADATLRAVEAAMADDERGGFTLALDGAKLIDAFERRYVLVAVHAITDREVTPLSGAAGVSDAPDRAVILATLQATDRWVRGRV